MTLQDKIDRIWCDVYARAFVLLTRPVAGMYQGYSPSEASEVARRLASDAVAGMEPNSHPDNCVCTHCNGTGEAPATDTGNPAGERTYGDCSECGGTGRAS